jgi:hypothetical protein
MSVVLDFMKIYGVIMMPCVLVLIYLVLLRRLEGKFEFDKFIELAILGIGLNSSRQMLWDMIELCRTDQQKVGTYLLGMLAFFSASTIGVWKIFQQISRSYMPEKIQQAPSLAKRNRR